MNEELQFEEIVISFEGDTEEKNLNEIKVQLENSEGIGEVIFFANNVLKLNYSPYVLSEQMIIDLLAEYGIRPKQEEKIRSPFKRLIHKLAKANEKNFGSEPLECCKLNRDTEGHA